MVSYPGFESGTPAPDPGFVRGKECQRVQPRGQRTQSLVIGATAGVVALAVALGALRSSRAEDASSSATPSGQSPRGTDPVAVPPAPADPDRSIGGYDIWMSRDLGNGRWAVPVNLGPTVNTTNRELSPGVSADGELLYFASRDRPDSRGGEDIYVCAREGKGWGPAKNLGPTINTSLEEIAPCPFPDGTTLLFCRRDPVQRAYDLAVSVHVEGEWLEAIGLGRPLATPGEERFPSITADGKELFFAAQWRAGRGDYDIWQSYRDAGGAWSEPINLGPVINTREAEYSPAISPDGKRLFFAAQRSESQDYDLYMSERKEGGTWQEPVRLPEPVRSRFNEYCPTVGPDGKTLYFSSDRDRGQEIAPAIEE